MFESIRQNKEKGGTLVGIHRSLQPVLIEEYDEKFELIVTEIKIANKEIDTSNVRIRTTGELER